MNNYLRDFKKMKGYNLYPNFNHQDYLIVRNNFILKYSWAIPNDKAIKEICKFGSIIEIGSGGGYWAYLINKNGIKIVAFDNLETHQENKCKKWFNVKHGSFEKIKDYPNNTLFLYWPPYENSMAYECLKVYKGEYFIYVGEEIEGCTGDENFFNEIFNNWLEFKKIDIPSFGGVYDSLFIYKRKK